MPARKARPPANVYSLLDSRLHQKECQAHQVQNQKRKIHLHLQGRQAQCHPGHRKRTRKGRRQNRNQKKKSRQKGKEMIQQLFKHQSSLSAAPLNITLAL